MDRLLSDQTIFSFISAYPWDYWNQVLACLARYAINSMRARSPTLPTLVELERISAQGAVNDVLGEQLTEIHSLLHRLDKRMLRTLKDSGMLFPRREDAVNKHSRVGNDMGGRTVPASETSRPCTASHSLCIPCRQY